MKKFLGILLWVVVMLFGITLMNAPIGLILHRGFFVRFFGWTENYSVTIFFAGTIISIGGCCLLFEAISPSGLKSGK